jgi:hypothetical protein
MGGGVPHQSVRGPPARTLEASTDTPREPSTCKVVLRASTGMSTMRNAAAAVDADSVFTQIGQAAVAS